MTRRGPVVTIAVVAAALLTAALFWIRPARAGDGTTCGHLLSRTLRVRVWEPGGVAPTVSVNVPVVLVSTVLKVASMTGVLDRTLEEAARAGGDAAPVHLKAAQVEALWRQVSHSGPVQLVFADDGDGGRVEVRID